MYVPCPACWRKLMAGEIESAVVHWCDFENDPTCAPFASAEAWRMAGGPGDEGEPVPVRVSVDMPVSRADPQQLSLPLMGES
jgi:hypothetical protein